MDISDTLTPTSDQLDAIELIGGPRTFTIERVTKGSAEQPVNVHLAEFPRPWRPGKSMRRVLAACWGTDASTWTGRRVTLYCDETIRFGSEVVGGTRISHLSHIDKARSVPLLVSRGKSARFTVQPLTDVQPPAQTAAVDPDAVTEAQLKKIGAAMRDLGMTDRDHALEFVAKTITREVSSRNELTKAEASALIDELEELAAGQGEQQPAADAGADPWAGDQP